MTDQIPTQQHSRSVPVRILSSAAAGATALTTVLAALDQVPPWVVIVVGGVGTVIPIVLGEWTKTQVTPWADVAAKRTPDGEIVAGPAANQATGSGVVVEAVAPEAPHAI